MRHDDDQPLPLSHLRTPVPLTQLDYAAVRARVRSELARPRRSVWVLALRFAAVVVLVFVMWPSRREVVPARPGGAAGFSPPVKTATQAGGLKPAAPQGPAPTQVVVHRKPRRVRRAREREQTTTLSRIEIHTADPDIRIIWIVPKENS